MAEYSFDTVVHSRPSLRGYGGVSVTRNGDIIDVSINGSLTFASYTPGESSYAYRYAVSVYYNNNYKGYFYIKDTYGLQWSSADLANYPNRTASNKGTVSFTDSSSGILDIYYCCCANPPYDYPSGCDVNDIYSKFPVLNVEVEAGYKYPTIDIDSYTKIGRFDTQSIQAHNTPNYAPDSAGTTVIWEGFYGNNHPMWTSNVGNNAGYLSDALGGRYLQPNSDGLGCPDGASFTLRAGRRHNVNSGWWPYVDRTIYTYRTPKIESFSVNPVNYSGTGNTTLNWSTNGRKWGDSEGEANFKTYIKFGTDNVWFESTNSQPTQQQNNTMFPQSQSLTKAIIDAHMTAAQRSQDSVSTTMQMRRRNESSGVNSDTNSINVTVQFRPKYRPDTDTDITHTPASLIFRKNNSTGDQISPGATIYIDESPNVYVQWTYPSNADGGVVNGYIVRIYDSSNNLVKTYTVNNSANTASLLMSIKDLKRGELNNISITAFYIKPNGSGNLEGPALTSKFILPIGKLTKPVIAYPINLTQWHNTKFRILFTLPVDADFDTYSSAIQSGGYRYKNIEVKINDTFTFAFASGTENMTSGAIICPEAFSTITIGYQKKICINPSLVPNFPISQSYKISLRVQKNYYLPIWSKWSDADGTGSVSITQSGISWSIAQGTPILDTHFNLMRNWSIRLYNVYPIQVLDSGNKVTAKGDIINRIQYSSIYNTVLGIQNGVNTYAQYDANRQDVKFNQTIDELSGSNSVTQELITALTDPRPNPEGRNYIAILVNCMNKLF